MNRIVIIGGGASGLMAAIAAKREDNEVIILERNNNCGKKLLMTGNGRCNYWNQFQDLKYYNSSNKKILKEIIKTKNQQKVLSFFDKIGIVPKIKNGYYYPYSNQALSIKNALLYQAELLKIKIKTNTFVKTVSKDNHGFIISTSNEQIIADKVILATGSKATPKTGSDGIGYEIAKSFNHSIVDVVPALVQLRGNESYFKIWSGVRCDATVSLFENDKKIQEESGELQLTDYGISGICTFNISSAISRGLNENKQEIVKIDFLPFLDINREQDFINYFEEKNKVVIKRSIFQILEGMLNYKLINVILKQSQINSDKSWGELLSFERKMLYQNLKLFELKIIGTNGFDKAQVCSGGIPLTEINVNTMESTKQNNLYIIGELLDVDGFCGGYNLSFAWISGMLAGGDAKKDD